MIEKIFHKLFYRIAEFIFHNKYKVFIFSIFLTILSLISIKSLKVDSNLSALLPDNHPVVLRLKQISKIYGGVGSLILVVRSENYKNSVNFIKAIIPKIKNHKDVRYVEYKKPLELIKKNLLLYSDYRDIKKLRYRLEKKINYERMKHNPLLFDLEEEPDPGFTIDDLLNKYKRRYKIKDNISKKISKQGHYYHKVETINHKKIHTFVILIKPSKPALDIKYSKYILQEIQHIIDKTKQNKKYSHIFTEFTGRYKKKPDAFEFLKKDFTQVTLFSILGIIFILILYFRSFWPIFLVFISLITGIIWTLGFASFTFGQLNLITSFLIAILLGLGIDFGIHFFLRYKEEKLHLNSHEAFVTMFVETGLASFSSALTTTIAFMGLAFTEFRAFSEFGIIAGVGILFILLAFLLFFSSLLVILESKVDLNKKTSNIKMPLFQLKHPKILILFFIILISIGVYLINFIEFNYDFSKIQNKNLRSFQVDVEVNKMFNRSLTPSVILPGSVKEEKKILSKINQYIRKNKNKKNNRIDKVYSILSFLPENQNKKLIELKKINQLLSKNRKYAITLPKKLRDKWTDLEKMSEVKKITIKTLPLAVKKSFMGIDQYKDKRVILVFPKADLSQGLEVLQFSNQLDQIEVNGKPLEVASDAMIFAEILRIIQNEGPYILFFTILGVLLIVSINFSSVVEGLIIGIPLLGAFLLVIALLALLSIPLDFFNVIMFPIILGIGVDSFIHIFYRYKESKNLPMAIQNTGNSTALSSATTIIGFGALMLAGNEAMQSMGLISIIGISFTFITSIIVLPAIIQNVLVKKNNF